MRQLQRHNTDYKLGDNCLFFATLQAPADFLSTNNIIIEYVWGNFVWLDLLTGVLHLVFNFDNWMKESTSKNPFL